MTVFYNYHKRRHRSEMEYGFQRHEPCFGMVLFVLTLDKKKMKERIVAGTEAAVRSRLRGNQDSEVICDVIRQLGTFLIEFEQDPDGEWNRLDLAPLREALHTNRWKQPDLEKTAGSFLRQKYQTGDPVRQYAAFRIWEGYLVAREYRNRSAACNRFIESVSPFTLAFQTILISAWAGPRHLTHPTGFLHSFCQKIQGLPSGLRIKEWV